MILALAMDLRGRSGSLMTLPSARVALRLSEGLMSDCLPLRGLDSRCLRRPALLRSRVWT